MANVGPSQKANRKISLNWSKPATWKTGKVIVCSQAPHIREAQPVFWVVLQTFIVELDSDCKVCFPISLSVPLLKDICQK